MVDPTTRRLLGDVSAGIRVLVSRDGVGLSEAQIVERARNIVMAIIAGYRVEAIGLEDDDDGFGGGFGGPAGARDRVHHGRAAGDGAANDTTGAFDGDAAFASSD